MKYFILVIFQTNKLLKAAHNNDAEYYEQKPGKLIAFAGL